MSQNIKVNKPIHIYNLSYKYGQIKGNNIKRLVNIALELSSDPLNQGVGIQYNYYPFTQIAIYSKGQCTWTKAIGFDSVDHDGNTTLLHIKHEDPGDVLDFV